MVLKVVASRPISLGPDGDALSARLPSPRRLAAEFSDRNGTSMRWDISETTRIPPAPAASPAQSSARFMAETRLENCGSGTTSASSVVPTDTAPTWSSP